MSLTNTSSFIKKNAGVAIFVCAVMVLTYLIYNRLTGEQTTKLELLKYPQIVQLPLKTQKFSVQLLDEPEIAKELPVYSTTPSIDFLADSKKIQGTFGITTNEFKSSSLEGKTIVTTSGDSGILSLQEEFLSYQKLLAKNTVTQENFDEQKSANTATTYLRNLNLPFELSTESTQSYVHFIGEDYYTDKVAQDASWLNINYNSKVEGLPIVSPTNQTVVSLNKAGDIMKVEVYPPRIRKNIGSYPTIKAEKAVKYLQEGKGYPISIAGKGTIYIGDSKHRNIQLAQINAMYPAYYSSTKDDTEHPVWLIDAQTTINKEPATISYVVFAVDPRFYEQPTNTTQP